MLAALAVISVFILQGVVFALDELFCHRQRGLGKWEILGHPLDTLTVAAALYVPAFVPFGERAAWGFALLAAISSLVVTKDELVHLHLCGRFEMWLHALMFMLHPLQFVAAALAWLSAWGLMAGFSGFELLERHGVAALRVVWGMTVATMAFQIVFWGRKWPKTQL